MTQEDILAYLREHKGRFFTAKELAAELDCSYRSITQSLQTMKKWYKFYSVRKVYINSIVCCYGIIPPNYTDDEIRCMLVEEPNESRCINTIHAKK